MKAGDKVKILNKWSKYYDQVGTIVKEGKPCTWLVVEMSDGSMSSVHMLYLEVVA